MNYLSLFEVAHAQNCSTNASGTTTCQPLWGTATTTAMVSSTETALAGQVVGALPIIIPVTIGLAVFFFFFRWLLSRGRGRH